MQRQIFYFSSKRKKKRKRIPSFPLRNFIYIIYLLKLVTAHPEKIGPNRLKSLHVEKTQSRMSGIAKCFTFCLVIFVVTSQMYIIMFNIEVHKPITTMEIVLANNTEDIELMKKVIEGLQIQLQESRNQLDQSRNMAVDILSNMRKHKTNSEKNQNIQRLKQMVVDLENKFTKNRLDVEQLVLTLTYHNETQKKILLDKEKEKVQDNFAMNEFRRQVGERKAFDGSKHLLSLVVPVRNRDAQLETFSLMMHTYFAGINIKWRILAIEQSSDGQPFNKGILLNTGFNISRQDGDYFCTHDVDHVPAQPYIDYSYPEKNPRHLSVQSQSTYWELPYSYLVGGVTCYTNAQFEKLNGYSNDFWGWGGEDDEMAQRFEATSTKISRPEISYFFAMSTGHNRDPLNKQMYKQNLEIMNQSASRWRSDGLSNLNSTIVKKIETKLYTRYVVDINRVRNQ